jgi:hypothetical protein
VGAYEKPVLIITALNEEIFKGEKITFYPNPLNPGEALHFKGGEGPFSIELYNIAGMQVAKTENVESDYYFPSGIPSSAIYIIKITDSKGSTETGKIIVR